MTSRLYVCPHFFVFVYSFFFLIMDCVIFMWGKLMSPMCKLWLHSLYGLYGHRCLLSEKADKLNHSLTRSMLTRPLARVSVIRSQIIKMAVKILGHGKFKMSIDTNTLEFGNKVKYTKYFTIKWKKNGRLTFKMWRYWLPNLRLFYHYYRSNGVFCFILFTFWYISVNITLFILNKVFFGILQILKTIDCCWNLLTTAS